MIRDKSGDSTMIRDKGVSGKPAPNGKADDLLTSATSANGKTHGQSNPDDRFTAEESARKLDILEGINAIPVKLMPVCLKPLAKRLMSRSSYGQGSCWASYNTLAKETGYSRGNIRLQIPRLLKLEWFVFNGRHHSESRHAKPEFKVGPRMIQYLRSYFTLVDNRDRVSSNQVASVPSNLGADQVASVPSNQVASVPSNNPVLSTGLKKKTTTTKLCGVSPSEFESDGDLEKSSSSFLPLPESGGTESKSEGYRAGPARGRGGRRARAGTAALQRRRRPAGRRPGRDADPGRRPEMAGRLVLGRVGDPPRGQTQEPGQGEEGGRGLGMDRRDLAALGAGGFRAAGVRRLARRADCRATDDGGARFLQPTGLREGTMSEFDDNPFPLIDDLYHAWLECGCRCTGTKTDGKPCRAICREVPYPWFWPGTSDRCTHHVDGLDRRSREIADIASKSGAAKLEIYSPFHRARKLRGNPPRREPEEPPVRRSASSPVEPASQRPDHAGPINGHG